MPRLHLLLAATLGTTAAFGVMSCQTGDTPSPGGPPVTLGDGGTPDDAGPQHIPFVPVPAHVYVAKVKNLLVGLPPTDDELKAVVKDPAALKGLIDGWMKLPEYRVKMLAFFRNAFQQSQISFNDLDQANGVNITNNGAVANRLLQNVRESFALTAWQLVSEGRPLSDAVTTQRFMVTPPLLAYYAYLDALHFDDKGRAIDRVVQANPTFQFTVSAASGPIPITQTLDPTSANYMHWYSPTIGTAGLGAGCQTDPRVYSRNSIQLAQLVFGMLPAFTGGCNQAQTPSQFADAEFDQWRMVTIRGPRQGESPTPFYDLPKMRAGTELVTNIPRIGFFSTPAFFANWQTNTSNQARVTMNQTLIVALGKSFDDTNSITPVSETGLDGQHADPTSACYACHKTLDPMRQFFRQAYTLSYRDQLDPAQASVQGVFAFGGVTAQGNGIGDLGRMLATHPRFATAWVEKLCYYANSTECVLDDPEFLRLVGVFQQSKFSWNDLVRELFASPLTTGASDTKTFDDNGFTVPIARRDHLCVALSNRLGIADVCGTGGEQPLTPAQRSALGIATVLPSDGYSRGAEAPVLANDPTLFFRAGVENLCRIVADQVVDAKPTTRYTSGKPDEAIADFVATVMALAPSDPRAAPAQAILKGHYDSAKQGGATAPDALKSTFVLACMSPSTVGMGL